MNHLKFGEMGEEIASEYLKKLGWRILDRNIRIGRGELDIAAMDGDELVIVEVRSRRIGKIMSSEESVGPHKLRSVIKTARKYIESISYRGNWRIDVLAVTEDKNRGISVELFCDVTTGMKGW
ncbi:MAG: YraN family protein [Synergistaceae bacterium]|nr:YraN family protein [Synergistaceae bacterium]